MYHLPQPLHNKISFRFVSFPSKVILAVIHTHHIHTHIIIIIHAIVLSLSLSLVVLSLVQSLAGFCAQLGYTEMNRKEGGCRHQRRGGPVRHADGLALLRL